MSFVMITCNQNTEKKKKPCYMDIDHFIVQKKIYLRRYSKQNEQNLILQIPKVTNQKVIGFMKDELR